jgi:argininosuccinate lyase
MYEQYLADVLGADLAGRLHTGRSRNDLKATATAMRLRRWTLDFVAEAVRLQGVLLARARAHRDAVMPAYTHFQAAMPITYGYYLTGVALALGRDLDALRHAAAGLDTCPMGAGAVSGSDLPIEPARVARLLGFDTPPVHAMDTVASRDTALRILGAVAGLSLTLSRLATDLQLWSTAEFALLSFPDRLVGGSSAMPQKRNAFLLEHVKAKAGVAVGAWTAAAAATKSTPFTNTIEVSTEAVAAVWPGLDAVRDSVQLAQSLVSGARPSAEQGRRRAEEGFVTATTLANRLVHQGVPFREAHARVGDAVRRAVAAGTTMLDLDPPAQAVGSLSPAATVAGLNRGGGPGQFDSSFTTARTSVLAATTWCRQRRSRLARSAEELDLAVAAVTKEAA